MLAGCSPSAPSSDRSEECEQSWRGQLSESIKLMEGVAATGEVPLRIRLPKKGGGVTRYWHRVHHGIEESNRCPIPPEVRAHCDYIGMLADVGLRLLAADHARKLIKLRTTEWGPSPGRWDPLRGAWFALDHGLMTFQVIPWATHEITDKPDAHARLYTLLDGVAKSWHQSIAAYDQSFMFLGDAPTTERMVTAALRDAGMDVLPRRPDQSLADWAWSAPHATLDRWATEAAANPQLRADDPLTKSLESGRFRPEVFAAALAKAAGTQP